jgi:hypothetical protein
MKKYRNLKIYLNNYERYKFNITILIKLESKLSNSIYYPLFIRLKTIAEVQLKYLT